MTNFIIKYDSSNLINSNHLKLYNIILFTNSRYTKEVKIVVLVRENDLGDKLLNDFS